jgi:hypothetical protein
MLFDSEERLFQTKILYEISRYLALYQIPERTFLETLKLRKEEWQRILTSCQPITAFQLHKVAEAIGISADVLLPNIRTTRADIMMMMVHDLPADLFEHLFAETVACAQQAERRKTSEPILSQTRHPLPRNNDTH